MESGYKVYWTDHALIELASTYEYLEVNFTERELKILSTEIDKVLKLIAKNPTLFPCPPAGAALSEIKGVRKIVIKKFNTLYYREKDKNIEILSFFSNRQNPDKRNI